MEWGDLFQIITHIQNPLVQDETKEITITLIITVATVIIIIIITITVITMIIIDMYLWNWIKQKFPDEVLTTTIRVMTKSSKETVINVVSQDITLVTVEEERPKFLTLKTTNKI